MAPPSKRQLCSLSAKDLHLLALSNSWVHSEVQLLGSYCPKSRYTGHSEREGAVENRASPIRTYRMKGSYFKMGLGAQSLALGGLWPSFPGRPPFKSSLCYLACKAFLAPSILKFVLVKWGLPYGWGSGFLWVLTCRRFLQDRFEQTVFMNQLVS